MEKQDIQMREKDFDGVTESYTFAVSSENREVSMNFDAVYVPDILEDFLSFMKAAGFTYITGISAESGDKEWSTEESECEWEETNEEDSGPVIYGG